MRTLLAIAALSILPGAVAFAATAVPVSDVPPYRLDPEVWQRAVVTEVMVDPRGAPADIGQWIELSNLGAEAVNLQGMVLATRSGGFHVLSPAQELLLAPGQALALGRAAGADQNGGVPVGYAYGDDLLLAQESEVLLLLWNNALVDFTAWGNGVDDRVEPGRSWSLEPPAPGGTGFKKWCPGRSPCGTGTDRGTPGLVNEYCDSDGDGFAEDQGDCDDDNASTGPGMPELCNGVDDDCDGETDEEAVPPPLCLTTGVCSVVTARCAGTSGFVCDYPAQWQDAETSCDGLDNDCDGETDEDLAWNGLALGAPCTAPGVCGDGTVVCSPTTLAATCSTLPDGTTPGEGPETCNDRDDDCDGGTDEDFALGGPCSAGLGACARTGKRVCAPDGGAQCDVGPGLPADEVCGDDLDNDCDGEVDEGFPVGDTCSVGLGACRAVGKLRCAEDGGSVTCVATPALPGAEVCVDGIDNDCDGTVDEDDCVRASQAEGGCTAGSLPSAPAILLMLLGLAGIGSRRRNNGT